MGSLGLHNIFFKWSLKVDLISLMRKLAMRVSDFTTDFFQTVTKVDLLILMGKVWKGRFKKKGKCISCVLF